MKNNNNYTIEDGCEKIIFEIKLLNDKLLEYTCNLEYFLSKKDKDDIDEIFLTFDKIKKTKDKLLYKIEVLKLVNNINIY